MDCVSVPEKERRGVAGGRKEVEKRYIALPETLSHIKSFEDESVIYFNTNFQSPTCCAE